MPTYKQIYSFEVLNALIDGKKVNMVDRELMECHKVDMLTVGEFVEVLQDAKQNKTRFDFWVEEEEGAEKNEAV